MFSGGASLPEGFEVDLDDILLYHILAREYGWTPEEVQAVPWKTLQGLLVLLQVTLARQHSAEQEKRENMIEP